MFSDAFCVHTIYYIIVLTGTVFYSVIGIMIKTTGFSAQHCISFEKDDKPVNIKFILIFQIWQAGSGLSGLPIVFVNIMNGYTLSGLMYAAYSLRKLLYIHCGFSTSLVLTTLAMNVHQYLYYMVHISGWIKYEPYCRKGYTDNVTCQSLLKFRRKVLIWSSDTIVSAMIGQGILTTPTHSSSVRWKKGTTNWMVNWIAPYTWCMTGTWVSFTSMFHCMVKIIVSNIYAGEWSL